MRNTDDKIGKIVVTIDPDLEELIPSFLENRHKDIISIQDALKTEDYETIRIIGHSMKGSGGGYGFDYITEIGEAIELAAKDKNEDEIAKSNNKLAEYMERVEVVYG